MKTPLGKALFVAGCAVMSAGSIAFCAVILHGIIAWAGSPLIPHFAHGWAIIGILCAIGIALILLHFGAYVEERAELQAWDDFRRFFGGKDH